MAREFFTANRLKMHVIPPAPIASVSLLSPVPQPQSVAVVAATEASAFTFEAAEIEKYSRSPSNIIPPGGVNGSPFLHPLQQAPRPAPTDPALNYLLHHLWTMVAELTAQRENSKAIASSSISSSAGNMKSPIVRPVKVQPITCPSNGWPLAHGALWSPGPPTVPPRPRVAPIFPPGQQQQNQRSPPGMLTRTFTGPISLPRDLVLKLALGELARVFGADFAEWFTPEKQLVLKDAGATHSPLDSSVSSSNGTVFENAQAEDGAFLQTRGYEGVLIDHSRPIQSEQTLLNDQDQTFTGINGFPAADDGEMSDNVFERTANESFRPSGHSATSTPNHHQACLNRTAPGLRDLNASQVSAMLNLEIAAASGPLDPLITSHGVFSPSTPHSTPQEEFDSNRMVDQLTGSVAETHKAAPSSEEDKIPETLPSGFASIRITDQILDTVVEISESTSLNEEEQAPETQPDSTYQDDVTQSKFQAESSITESGTLFSALGIETAKADSSNATFILRGAADESPEASEDVVSSSSLAASNLRQAGQLQTTPGSKRENSGLADLFSAKKGRYTRQDSSSSSGSSGFSGDSVLASSTRSLPQSPQPHIGKIAADWTARVQGALTKGNVLQQSALRPLPAVDQQASKTSSFRDFCNAVPPAGPVQIPYPIAKLASMMTYEPAQYASADYMHLIPEPLYPRDANRYYVRQIRFRDYVDRLRMSPHAALDQLGNVPYPYIMAGMAIFPGGQTNP